MKYRHWILIASLALSSAACVIENHAPAEMASISSSQPKGQETTIDAEVQFPIGTLEVGGERGGAAYSLDVDYDKSSYEPDIRYTTADGGGRGVLTFRLEGGGKPQIRAGRQQNRARLNLSTAVPVRMRLNSGVGDTRLSLTGLQVARLELEAGVGEARLSMYEPNPVVCDAVRIKSGVGQMTATGLGNLNFRDFEFEGGVGGASLEFSGQIQQDANLRIQVGIGGVSVRLPREIGVRVDAEKNFLSGLHLEGLSRRDSGYYSENYDKAKVRLSFRVATGVGGFRISWL
jgi:hypothetical protein